MVAQGVVLAAAVVGATAAVAVGAAPAVLATAELALYPGTRAAIVLRVDILGGRYIQDHQPALPHLVPTQVTVTVDGAAGIAVGPVRYPVSERKWFSFARRELGVYSGEVEFTVPLVVDRDAEPGMRTIRARIDYQACSDRVCYPPAVEELVVLVQVLPPESVSSGARASLWALRAAIPLTLGILVVRRRRLSRGAAGPPPVP